MRVGIITIHNHLNYGAVLQVFALNRIVQRLGHRCKIINCNIEPGHARQFSRSKHPGEQIKNLYLAYHWRANRSHRQRFQKFRQQHIPLTDTSYESFEQLIAFPPQFDTYITGSDQVWRPIRQGKASWIYRSTITIQKGSSGMDADGLLKLLAWTDIARQHRLK